MNHNPFATRFTTPGNVPYLADAGLSARLHDTWQKSGRIGVIIGPHGSGKSTLLATLERLWSLEQSYRVTRIALHDGQRDLPREFWDRSFQEHDLLIVDGYEQLGWLARWRLQRMRLKTSCGLLVTAHDAVRLPMLYRVEPAYGTLLAVVRRLLEPWGNSSRTEDFIAHHAQAAWRLTGGNTRETLFRLYDLWEEESVANSQEVYLPI